MNVLLLIRDLPDYTGSPTLSGNIRAWLGWQGFSKQEGVVTFSFTPFRYYFESSVLVTEVTVVTIMSSVVLFRHRQTTRARLSDEE